MFAAAVAERWRLEEHGAAPPATLVIGNEDWPFPVPLVEDGSRWRFDTAAGQEEILDRRIGRNELAVIQICRTYVARAARVAASADTTALQRGVFATPRSAASRAARTGCMLARGARRDGAVRSAISSRRRRRRGRSIGQALGGALAVPWLLLPGF